MKRLITLAVSVAVACSAAAQPCTHEWMGVTTGTQSGGVNAVRCLAVFDDGTGPALYVGGQFTTAGGVAATNIARWDGTAWSAVGGGVTGTVFAMQVFDDGSGPALFVSGSFTQAGGAPASRVAKWNGAAWSPLGSGMNGSAVTAMAVFDDGGGPDLYFGGNFTMAGGVPCFKIARYDGTTFSPLAGGIGLPPPAAPIVYALAAFDDGTGPALYAGGAFPSADNGAVIATNIVKWDGAAYHPVGSGMDDTVSALLAFDDGGGEGPSLYAAGEFLLAGGVLASGVARWDGFQWNPLGDGLDGAVSALTIYDDGAGPALHAGGDFLASGAVPAARVARWNGASWAGLAGGLDDGAVLALAGFGPHLYAGGSFSTASGAMTRRVARWACNPEGACCLPSGVCEVKTALACSLDGGTYAGDLTDCGSIPPCTPAPTGACCLPSGCVTLWESGLGGCVTQNGLYHGDGTVCGTQCDGLVFEVEPNSNKESANAAVLAPGGGIVGVSTGTAAGTGDADSADYFLVQTPAAPLGIYRHRLTMANNNPSTPNNSGSLPGVAQTPVVGGVWPCAVGTLSATETAGQPHFLDGADRINIWYGFGRQEMVHYRVSGAATTGTVYVAVLDSVPVTPTNLGTFEPGIITIDTSGQGHTNDTYVRIYGADLEPIEGYSNDGATINGGAPANVNTTSFLRREYAPGVYYMGITMTNLASNVGTPCDDNRRAGSMQDFPGSAVATGSSAATDVSFSITDAAGTTPVAADRGGRGEIAWFTFTVGASCPVDWNGDDAVNSTDISAFLGTWLTSVGVPDLAADFNGDGVTNSTDISAFLAAWLEAVTIGC